MKRLIVFTACFALGAAVTARAADSVLGKRDTSQPITINADQVQADLNAKSLTYNGNVVVTQGDIRMRANTIKVNSVNGKADNIQAQGGVVVDSPASGTATGDTGVYQVAARTVTLTGRPVVLKRAKDVMRGTQLTINLVTGKAVLGAKAVAGAPALPGGRVQGVFTPSGQ